MLPSLLFTLHACLVGPCTESAAPVEPLRIQGTNPDEAEYEKRRKSAEKDADKLWDLHEWCLQKKLEKQAKSCLRRIVQLKPDDEKAHKLLGDVAYDGKWFASEKKVEEYKKQQAEKVAKEEEKAAKEKGLVKYKDQWVPAVDLPLLQKGLVRNDRGEWINPEELKKIAEGWVKQDLEWVSPQEKENIGKGLWKCGDKWLDLEKADEYHSDFFKWWKIPHEGKFVLYTTCDRKVAEQIGKHLANSFADLVKCYGVTPPTPPVVIVLRNQDQYGAFAAGDQDEGRNQTESGGLSSTHYAYFADVCVDPDTGELTQCGVSYWDASTETGPKFAIHATRHALGHSFAEAIDPSPKALEKIKKDTRFDAKTFWDEKKLPLWFRYGAAGYAERYFTDLNVLVGGNSKWAIEWSTKNLLARGGLPPLPQVFDFEPDVDRLDESTIWYNRIGLVMWFIVDGKCAPVTEKLTALQDALKNGKDKKAVAESGKALMSEVVKHDTDLRKFTGL